MVYCQYPFVLDSMAKAELLKVESRVQMHVSALSIYTCMIDAWAFKAPPRATYSMFHSEDLEVAQYNCTLHSEAL